MSSAEIANLLEIRVVIDAPAGSSSFDFTCPRNGVIVEVRCLCTQTAVGGQLRAAVNGPPAADSNWAVVCDTAGAVTRSAVWTGTTRSVIVGDVFSVYGVSGGGGGNDVRGILTILIAPTGQTLS